MSEYLRRASEAYQGEVYGEALFAELSQRAGSPREAHVWRVLQQLESETKSRLRPLVERLGGELAESEEGKRRGAQEGQASAAKPFEEVVATFLTDLPKYVRFFEKLEALAEPGDRELLAKVTAHERALVSFAELEQRGDAAGSLAPVLALLDNPPTAPH